MPRRSSAIASSRATPPARRRDERVAGGEPQAVREVACIVAFDAHALGLERGQHDLGHGLSERMVEVGAT